MGASALIEQLADPFPMDLDQAFGVFFEEIAFPPQLVTSGRELPDVLINRPVALLY